MPNKNSVDTTGVIKKKQRPKKRMLIIVSIVLLFLIIVLTITGIIWSRGESMEKNQVALHEYLVNKYGGEFTIGKIDSESSGFETAFISAPAKKLGEDFNFTVSRTQDGFHDTYHNASWSAEEKPNINDVIAGFSNQYQLKEITVSIKPSQDLENKLGGTRPKYTEVKAVSASQMKYGVDLQWEIRSEDYEDTINNLNNDIPKLASYIQDQQLSTSYLGMRIYDKHQKIRYTCVLSSDNGSIAEQAKKLNNCFKKTEE